MRKFTAVGIAVATLIALSSCGGNEEATKIEGATTTATQDTATTPAAPESPANTPTPAPPTTTPTATPRPATLEKVSDEFAVAQNSFDSQYRHEWIAMLSNQSDKLADGIRIQALFYSESNVLLGTSEDYAYVWPGQTSPAHGSISFAERAARMEIRVAGNPRFSDVKTKLFPVVVEAQIVRDRFSAKVSGTTTSPWTTDVEDLQTVCVLRDAGGALVGVESSFLDLLPGGATAVVECSYVSSDKAATATTAEIFLVLTSISRVVE